MKLVISLTLLLTLSHFIFASPVLAASLEEVKMQCSKGNFATALQQFDQLDQDEARRSQNAMQQGQLRNSTSAVRPA
ncbi:MAG: hypothetical protein K2X93_14505 [Candidatus Obscuribacterales bacterium]|nr:hypothetical protein [Candidatus Obscuribacterales bacterium]